MKVVMYHYVREFDRERPKFRFLHIRDFRKQLDFFDRHFGFVTREEWRSFIKAGVLPEIPGKVLLTFDDALSCHYDYVFEELKQRGLWATFFVPTMPYAESRILDVHRIHLLAGTFSGRDLLGLLMKLVSEEMILDCKREEFRSETYVNQRNYEGVSEFKRFLNYYVGYDCRSALIDEIGRQLSYRFDVKRFYISKEGLQKMQSYGMVIGSHTVTHPVMSRLSTSNQFNEILRSFEKLESMGVCEQRVYCHPYGGAHSFNADTIKILSELGVLYGFSVESSEVGKDDLLMRRYALPRFDCNYFEHGGAS